MTGPRIYGHTSRVSTRTPQLSEALDRVEALTVAELARTVHADGFRFRGWPTVTRTWVGFSIEDGEAEFYPGHRAVTHVRIHLDVVAEER